MKKILITAALFLLGTTAFCQQEEENGTIYIKHPYIEVVNNAVKAYLAQDAATLKTYYADSAQYWISGIENFIPIADAFKTWWLGFEKNDITMTQVGYPDYLHYIKDDAKVVQSWWIWTAKPKDGSAEIKVYTEILNFFNNDGKIVRQIMFGDFSKMQAQQSSSQ